MEKTIKLRVRREKDSSSELKILKLKGALITSGYTEIIHIADENEEFYMNSFSTAAEQRKEAEKFVLDFISSNDLSETVALVNS